MPHTGSNQRDRGSPVLLSARTDSKLLDRRSRRPPQPSYVSTASLLGCESCFALSAGYWGIVSREPDSGSIPEQQNSGLICSSTTPYMAGVGISSRRVSAPPTQTHGRMARVRCEPSFPEGALAYSAQEVWWAIKGYWTSATKGSGTVQGGSCTFPRNEKCSHTQSRLSAPRMSTPHDLAFWSAST